LPRNGVGWLGELFRSTGSSTETFWLKRPIDPTAVGRLMRLFRHHDIDVVHSHEFTMAVYGSTAARLLAIPHLMTMHGGLTITKALRRRLALRLHRLGGARRVSARCESGCMGHARTSCRGARRFEPSPIGRRRCWPTKANLGTGAQLARYGFRKTGEATAPYRPYPRRSPQSSL